MFYTIFINIKYSYNLYLNTFVLKKTFEVEYTFENKSFSVKVEFIPMQRQN